MQFSRDTYNTHNDDAFMQLLSSQRELLSQLSQEQMMRRNIGKSELSSSYRVSRGTFETNTCPTTCKNGNDRRSSMDLMISKRLSLGMGNDNYILPTFSCDFALDVSVHSFGDPLSKADLLAGPHKRSKCEDSFEPPAKRKKRRMSSLGFLTSVYFEENLKDVRRDSLASVFKQSIEEGQDDDEEDIDDLPLTEDEELDISFSKEEVTLYFGDTQEEQRPIQRVDPEQVKNLLGEFKAAMERSQKSQQDIHDWDRKMGLKRSHSKTMRLSSRSRKKLRTLFKNEISSLLATL